MWMCSTKTNTYTNKSSNFNPRLHIDYRKLNSRVQKTHQIKADDSLSKVISNYSLPTVDIGML